MGSGFQLDEDEDSSRPTTLDHDPGSNIGMDVGYADADDEADEELGHAYGSSNGLNEGLVDQIQFISWYSPSSADIYFLSETICYVDTAKLRLSKLLFPFSFGFDAAGHSGGL
ncbi:hypothetical protein LIER_12050 [Lithospermum erythrorhizon]|uniref:Uncharacterized protein n=1 Tax=Lithospermum erythrorhizon TaxID=34254 RepID=A0AAV3PQD9_LITER